MFLYTNGYYIKRVPWKQKKNPLHYCTEFIDSIVCYHDLSFHVTMSLFLFKSQPMFSNCVILPLKSSISCYMRVIINLYIWHHACRVQKFNHEVNVNFEF